MTPKCKGCKFLRETRSNGTKYSWGRKDFWCVHEKAKDWNFVSFGENTAESEIKIKTSPRWCPLRKGEK